MFSLYPRPSASSPDGVGVVVEEEEEGDDVSRYRALYGIAVVCIPILLFCVLSATVDSVWKAFAFAVTAGLLLLVLGCSVPARGRQRGRPISPVLALTAAAPGGGGRAPPPPPPQRATGGWASCARVVVVDAPPAFAYVIGGPLESGGDQQTASSVMCLVCLEDVRGGEMVRRLPACMHVFHVGCVDMWLRSHRTCPTCRCVVSRSTAAVTPKAAAQPEQAPPPEPPEEEEAPLPPV